MAPTVRQKIPMAAPVDCGSATAATAGTTPRPGASVEPAATRAGSGTVVTAAMAGPEEAAATAAMADRFSVSAGTAGGEVRAIPAMAPQPPVGAVATPGAQRATAAGAEP